MLIASCAWAQNKVDPALASYEGRADLVTVIVHLKNQPRPEIARSARALREQSLRNISSDMIAALPKGAPASVSIADAARIVQLQQQAKAIRNAIGDEVNAKTRAAVLADQDALARSVESVGGRVIYRYLVRNAIAARVPGTAISAIAANPNVLYVAADRRMQTQLNISGPSLFVSTFWNAGEVGGTFMPATLDTGVTTTHPALSSHTWASHTFNDSGRLDPLYADNANTTSDLQSHGTHVAGIQLSADTTYRGVCFGSGDGMNLKAGWKATDGGGYMDDSDMYAAVDWALTQPNRPDALNLSFGGYDPANPPPDDTDSSRFWDSVVDDEGLSVAMAAGNSGPGDRTVGDPGLSYNVICVGNMSDQRTTSRADDTIAGSSSRGPTANGRKKPDICAPGMGIWSCNSSGSGFVQKSGTSMASPQVTGASILLQDAGVLDPRAVKAVLINTAEHRGNPGWDKAYGWGYMDLNRAYADRANYRMDSVAPRAQTGGFKLYRASAMQPGDKATLVWNRHAVYNPLTMPATYYALNNLDMMLYDANNGAQVASSTSTVDNVEQVLSDRTAPQVIKVVAGSASFAGVASEYYALAYPSNTVSATGPILSCYSSNYSPPLGAQFTVTAVAHNAGDLGAQDCHLSISLPTGVTLVSGAVSQSVGVAPVGADSGSASWVLRADAGGAMTVGLSVTSSTYAESWTGGGSFVVAPGSATTITDARGRPDGTWVLLPPKVVSATMLSLPTPLFYVQEPDRTCGIGVEGVLSTSEGEVVNVAGQLVTRDGERRIVLYTGHSYPGPGAPKPLGVRNNNLAGKALGAYEGQVPSASGANNVGLLVKTWGRVTAHLSGDFFIDDGSGLADAAKPGLKVSCSGLGLTLPNTDQYVSVTGISGVETFGGVPIRVIRPRRQSDIVPVATP